MHVVDPLFHKIQELLLKGRPYPVNLARQSFGTSSDIDQLIDRCLDTSELPGPERHYYIDLTPFERVGGLGRLIESIIVNPNRCGAILTMSRPILDEISSEYEHCPLPVLFFQKDGELEEIIGFSDVYGACRSHVELDFRYDTNRLNLSEFRRILARANLTKLLFDADCIDTPRLSDELEPTTEISGRLYRVMPNGMLVSCYLKLKDLGRDTNHLMRIAYEIMLNLFDYFRRDSDPLPNFDLIVAPNNTSLLIASMVRAIIEKPVLPIDRLGPIPSLQLHSERLKEFLFERRVVVIEEVVATGSEVDRTIMFLNHMGASLEKVVAAYNLEIGKPMLIDSHKMVSLCRPKRMLDYVYRSQIDALS